jgi:hypothetical protein
LGRVVPRAEVSRFTSKTASLMKKALLRDMFKKAYITTVLSPDSLVSYCISSFSYEDSRKHRRGS